MRRSTKAHSGVNRRSSVGVIRAVTWPLLIFTFTLVFLWHSHVPTISTRNYARTKRAYSKVTNKTTNLVAETFKGKRTSLAIIVVTDASTGEQEWVKARLSHFKCYAETFDYDFVHHVLDMKFYTEISFYTARWEAVFKTYWGKYEWIFTHDTDSMYPDFSMSLDKFIAAHNSADVHALARGTEIGANALLFRANSSDFSKTFIQRLISLGHRSPHPGAQSNYDVRDIMLVVLEFVYPELAESCRGIDDFFHFAKCFTPAIERLSLIPSITVPMKIHLPMSGFVQQYESPASNFGLLFGACWPGHLLMSGNGVKAKAPLPRDHGHTCAIDATMNGECRWMTHEEQKYAATECCLHHASVCAEHPKACLHEAYAKYVPCAVGWPVLWAGGGEVVDPILSKCREPYIALKVKGIAWNSSEYLETFTPRVQIKSK